MKKIHVLYTARITFSIYVYGDKKFDFHIIVLNLPRLARTQWVLSKIFFIVVDLKVLIIHYTLLLQFLENNIFSVIIEFSNWSHSNIKRSNEGYKCETIKKLSKDI